MNRFDVPINISADTGMVAVHAVHAVLDEGVLDDGVVREAVQVAIDGVRWRRVRRCPSVLLAGAASDFADASLRFLGLALCGKGRRWTVGKGYSFKLDIGFIEYVSLLAFAG